MFDAQATDAPIQLLRETASGPMSAVFIGRTETRLGARYVAVKLLRELPDGGVERLLDLRDRARPLALLDHRHHTPTLDVARVDERFALVSPYVDGLDLLDWLDLLTETGRVVPRRVSCEILRSVASALDVAARRPDPRTGAPLGLIHRDLKPSNVMITRDGALRVTDFGTGYTALAGRSARAGALKKGLVRYLSPERRDGERATSSADVYALGILAVELFRGKWLRRLRTRNPAHDRQLADVIARVEDLQMRSDSDDRSLRNLLLRMVAFEADARPEIAEVVSTLRTLTDRAEGPSLESYASAHALPWIDELPREPEPALAVATATVVERGQPLPPAGGGLPVVTLPDRYDLQVAAGENDTGEWSYEEVTDPRLRQTPPPAPARNLEATAAAISSPETADATVDPAPADTDARGGDPAEPRLALLPQAAPASVEAIFVGDGLHDATDPGHLQAGRGVPIDLPTGPEPLDDVELTPTEESPLAPGLPPANGVPFGGSAPSSLRWVLIFGGLASLVIAALLGAALVAALLFLTGPGALP